MDFFWIRAQSPDWKPNYHGTVILYSLIAQCESFKTESSANLSLSTLESVLLEVITIYLHYQEKNPRICQTEFETLMVGFHRILRVSFCVDSCKRKNWRWFITCPCKFAKLVYVCTLRFSNSDRHFIVESTTNLRTRQRGLREMEKINWFGLIMDFPKPHLPPL